MRDLRSALVLARFRVGDDVRLWNFRHIYIHASHLTLFLLLGDPVSIVASCRSCASDRSYPKPTTIFFILAIILRFLRVGVAVNILGALVCRPVVLGFFLSLFRRVFRSPTRLSLHLLRLSSFALVPVTESFPRLESLDSLAARRSESRGKQRNLPTGRVRRRDRGERPARERRNRHHGRTRAERPTRSLHERALPRFLVAIIRGSILGVGIRPEQRRALARADRSPVRG